MTELDLQKQHIQKKKISLKPTETNMEKQRLKMIMKHMATQCISTLPLLVWFDDMLLLRLRGNAVVDLGGLPPEPTEWAALFALCGGMGTGPLRAVGVMGSIAFCVLSLDWAANIKQHCQKEALDNPDSTQPHSGWGDHLYRHHFKLCENNNNSAAVWSKQKLIRLINALTLNHFTSWFNWLF